ncbi:MAG: hypothetical protein JXA89_05040 [Anaerolineae bacterium]|nr:hypothetical protein [Anaerolineae bacterium]
MTSEPKSSHSLDMLLRFSRAGALVRIVVQQDACPACSIHETKLYTPEDAPRLPISGCSSAYCRCRFEAVDPATKLSVSDLVERGAQLVKARLNRGALTALRRAVALDELYEPGWLWLSAVVERDEEKIHCLERVLFVNPQNAWARKNLKILRRKLGLITPARGTAPLIEMPLEVLQIRVDRQVIVEQWVAFMDVIAEAAPKIAYEQAVAFLSSLARANEQALEKLYTPFARKDELEQQWRELDIVGRSLGEAVRNFSSGLEYHADKQAMRGMFQRLFDEVMERRKTLNEKMGGPTNE